MSSAAPRRSRAASRFAAAPPVRPAPLPAAAAAMPRRLPRPPADDPAALAAAPADPRHREFVQGLQRGFAVVKAFSADGGRRLTVADVASRTGLTRAVARRYLLTLQELGYVVHDGSHFTLTPRILDLGFTYLATVDVANIAQPFMERIVHTLRESCSIAVLDGHDAVYVARVAAKRIMSINLVVGSRLPAHATSMGKVLLAHLSPQELDDYFRTAPLQRLTSRTIGDEPSLRAALKQVRERGWAFADQESEDGVRTVAVPLFDRTMQVQAAMNVSGHASRVPMKELRSRYLPVLMETANEISRALGANVPARQGRR
jgi:IclR family transcriptional regulator, pca regulon regulatory protein